MGEANRKLEHALDRLWDEDTSEGPSRIPVWRQTQREACELSKRLGRPVYASGVTSASHRILREINRQD